MKLNNEDKACLEQLYIHYAVPTDQLRRNAVVLGRIRAGFIRLTGIECDASELLRYMINRRKNRDWPTLGDRAQSFPPALSLIREKIDLLDLVSAYTELGVPLDWCLFDPRLARRLSGAIAERTGHIFKAAEVVAAAMALRKRGLLPEIAEERAQRKSTERKFADIEVVAQRHHRQSSAQS